jgi:hypothetical protein
MSAGFSDSLGFQLWGRGLGLLFIHTWELAMEITFEFLEGFMDGRTVSTDSEDENEAMLAPAYSAFTEGGKVGKRFVLVSDFAIENAPESATGHIYEVIERTEDQERVLVRAKFVKFN